MENLRVYEIGTPNFVHTFAKREDGKYSHMWWIVGETVHYHKSQWKNLLTEDGVNELLRNGTFYDALYPLNGKRNLVTAI